MPELDIVSAWTGACWWGSKRRYPDKASFIGALEREMYPEEEREFSEGAITETRLRHCVGGECGEGEPHWHPTDAKNGAPVWQYGDEWP